MTRKAQIKMIDCAERSIQGTIAILFEEENDEQGWIWNGYIFTTVCIFPLINISPHSYVLHSLPPTQFASSSLLLPAVRRFLLILPPRTPPSILFAYMCRRQ